MPNFFDRFDPSPVSANPRLAGAEAEATIKGAEAKTAPSMTAAELALKQAQAREARVKAEAAEKQAKPPLPEKSAILDLIDTARHARELSKDWFATGFGSETARKFGGASARSVAADLLKLKANEVVKQMPELKQRGVNLSPMTGEDVSLIAALAVSDDIGLNDEDFQRRMNQLMDSSRKLYMLSGGDIRDTFRVEDRPYMKEELERRKVEEALRERLHSGKK